PQLFSGRCIEGTESLVVGGTDEHQVAGRDRRTGAPGIALKLLALGQRLLQAERNRPLDRAAIGIDGNQARPGPLVAGQTGAHRAALLIIFAVDRRREAEEGALAVHAGAVILARLGRVETVGLAAL